MLGHCEEGGGEDLPGGPASLGGCVGAVWVATEGLLCVSGGVTVQLLLQGAPGDRAMCALRWHLKLLFTVLSDLELGS